MVRQFFRTGFSSLRITFLPALGDCSKGQCGIPRCTFAERPPPQTGGESETPQLCKTVLDSDPTEEGHPETALAQHTSKTKMGQRENKLAG